MIERDKASYGRFVWNRHPSLVRTAFFLLSCLLFLVVAWVLGMLLLSLTKRSDPTIPVCVRKKNGCRLSCLLVWAVGASLLFGCRTEYREDLDYSHKVLQTWKIEEIEEGVFVQFEDVFWEADDTTSLRKMIALDLIVDGKSVLEIGTGSGVLSIIALKSDAKRVVATDINPAAVANAKYNAAMLVPDRTLDVRQVSQKRPGAFEVIGESETFDIILSNPPWEDGVVAKPLDHAFYDPQFYLMETLLDGLPLHLKPGGRCLLAYGHRPAIERLQDQCKERGFAFKILDRRNLDDLKKDFLPGMVVEIRVPMAVRELETESDISDAEK